MAFDYDAELVRYHRRLLTAAEVRSDDEVLDIGCGTGLTTREAASVAASAVGVDISAESLATARELSRELRNVEFEQGDAQVFPFPAERFSLGISRFGTMFFTDIGTAFANIAGALRPGARLVQLVWQEQRHQEWSTLIGEALSDGRACPPAGGAFAMADPATTEGWLSAAGFTDIEFTDVREPVYYGPDVAAACEAALGLRLAQDLLANLSPDDTGQALQRLRTRFAERHTTTGIWLNTRAWLITAHRTL